jgi:hypothetical protein
MNRIRQAVEPLVRRACHLYWRFARGMTLGVRGLVIDKDQKIFLVTHTYARGSSVNGICFCGTRQPSLQWQCYCGD